jgi:hypothetical protein
MYGTKIDNQLRIVDLATPNGVKPTNIIGIIIGGRVKLL